jgi:hypothetical protein
MDAYCLRKLPIWGLYVELMKYRPSTARLSSRVLSGLYWTTVLAQVRVKVSKVHLFNGPFVAGRFK